MSDVFISYARSTEAQARRIEEALQALGYGVWRDDQLPAHRAYSEVLDERLKAAKAVLVVWSPEAVKSEWVQSEADRARTDKKLVQLTLDGAALPMPFDRIQCADFTGWTGDPDAPGWRKVVASVAELVGGTAPMSPAPAPTSQPKAPPLPDKPSIAVLPFADPAGAAGAAEGDYFADGMVDEIVTALAKFPALFVIGSSSSLSYRGRERDVAGIGRELGVRYLLEGSIRRSGQKVRISVTLVEAANGAQIWADRFEGTLEDVFVLQDEVANVVAARIEPNIAAADLRRGEARPTADQSAYDLYLRGRQRFQELDKESWQASKSLLEQAVARDPAYAPAWGLLATAEVIAAMWGWSDDAQASHRRAREAIRRASALTSDDARVLAQIAQASVMMGGDPESCEAMVQRALALNPGSAGVWIHACVVSSWAGHLDLALERGHHALRLDPRSRVSITTTMGATLEGLGRYAETIPWLEEGLTLRPNTPGPIFMLAHAYFRVGRTAEARAMLARGLALMPLETWFEHVVVRGTEAHNQLRREAFRALGADV
jgi:adenylate cyclase